MSIRPMDKSVRSSKVRLSFNKEWVLDVYPDGRYGKRIQKRFNGTLREARIAEQRLKYFHGDGAGISVLGEVLRKKVPTVYFVRQGLNGPIKIGWTKQSIASRLDTLQVANPCSLQLIGYVPNKGRDFEAEMHILFSAYRLRGEWFSPCVELLDRIKKDEQIITDM